MGSVRGGFVSRPPRALKVEASLSSRTAWLPGRSRGSASYRQVFGSYSLRSGVEPREEAGEVFSILEILGDQRRGVGVGEHVILEVFLFFKDVPDQAAQKNDVGAARRGA